MDNFDSQDYNLLKEVINCKNWLYQESFFEINEQKLVKNEPIKEDLSRGISLLGSQVSLCEKCPLFKTRTQTVFGAGYEKSPLMLIGEAPGSEEDKQGLPFVGSAGQLLTKMLNAIEIKREDVYICNVLKCRPPKNKNPNDNEIIQCSPYLERQIELVNPKVIVTLGNFATQFVLQTKTGITKLRGKSYHLNGRYIFPTFHPSALLHNPELKRGSWNDLKLLKQILQKLNIFPLRS